MVWVPVVRISMVCFELCMSMWGNSFYFRKMYGGVNLVGPGVPPRIENVKHGLLRLQFCRGGARTDEPFHHDEALTLPVRVVNNNHTSAKYTTHLLIISLYYVVTTTTACCHGYR